jgi:hypothetical protein
MEWSTTSSRMEIQRINSCSSWVAVGTEWATLYHSLSNEDVLRHVAIYTMLSSEASRQRRNWMFFSVAWLFRSGVLAEGVRLNTSAYLRFLEPLIIAFALLSETATGIKVIEQIGVTDTRKRMVSSSVRVKKLHQYQPLRGRNDSLLSSVLCNCIARFWLESNHIRFRISCIFD